MPAKGNAGSCLCFYSFVDDPCWEKAGWARALEPCSPPVCSSTVPTAWLQPPFLGTWAFLWAQTHCSWFCVPATCLQQAASSQPLVLPAGVLKAGSKEPRAHKDRDGLGLGVEPRAGLWPWHGFWGKRERWLGTGRCWSFHNNKTKIRGEK